MILAIKISHFSQVIMHNGIFRIGFLYRVWDTFCFIASLCPNESDPLGLVRTIDS